MIPLLLVAACAAEPDTEVDPGVPVDPLYLPDLSGVDLPAAFAEAFALALTTHTGPAWDGHVGSLALAIDGCPDLWAGAPDDTALDLDEDAGGTSWSDRCANGDGIGFEGSVWWDSTVAVEGDAASAEGRSAVAERRLVGDGTVGRGADLRYALDGAAEETLTRLDAADGYTRWVWSNLMDATIGGTTALDGTAFPGGVRADTYLAVTGGDVDALELRGNVYLFDDRVAERFDSVAFDLSFAGPTGASPATCTAEPRGWLAVRDTNAFWHDLVFLAPQGEELETELPDGCDGCGTLYVRGVESGEVCVDLASTWDGGLAPPDLAEFVLSVRDLP